MAATLSTSEILFDVLQAFKVRFPFLTAIATDFSTETVRLNQQVIARISVLPTVRNYDPTSGYEGDAANANDLVVDVPVTINRHKHVPVKVGYLDQISTRRNLYEEAIGNLAYALGKEAFDYAMSLVNSGTITAEEIFSVGNSDKDALDAVTIKLNGRGAAPIGRFGIVNSQVYNTLEADQRIINSQWYGQKREGNGYGHLVNVSGFQNVWEYPDFPTNNGPVVTLATSAAADDIIDTATAHGLVAGDRVVFPTLTGGTGLTALTPYYVIAANLGAQTLQVSTTKGGAAVNFSADITAGTIQKQENMTGFFGQRIAIVMASRLPVDVFAIAKNLGIPSIASAEVITDDETGMSLLGITWMKSGTFDLYTTVVWLYGLAVGNQNGDADSKTDKAGCRLVSL